MDRKRIDDDYAKMRSVRTTCEILFSIIGIFLPKSDIENLKI
jgi:hypothetical protein